MKIKLDENIGTSSLHLLADAGYEASSVYEEGLAGASDDHIWQVVTKEDKFFIILDLDFSDIRKYPTGSHSGILLLRPRLKGPNAVNSILKRLIEDYPLEKLKGKLAVADDYNTRVRA